jgi:hypothetical protein
MMTVNKLDKRENGVATAGNTTASTSYGKAAYRQYALMYFAGLLVIWNIAGQLFLGFEQSWLQQVVAVAAACITQLLLEFVDAQAQKRALRYQESARAAVVFFLPAIISGLAVGMLLYTNRSLLPVIFASVLAIASKVLFRAPVCSGTQHIFNPSNFGITCTLTLMPFVGLAAPYHFMENVSGIWTWLIPTIILLSGIFVHGAFTKRLPLVLAWLAGFVAQAILRHFAFGIPLIVPLAPMTSTAFLIFTLYMIPDPATTPIKPARQIAFGLAVAAVYCALQVMHLFFGLFVALLSISLLRGMILYGLAIFHIRKAKSSKNYDWQTNNKLDTLQADKSSRL